MKKTLALALVAAMTISVVSMTAFAGNVEYSDAPAIEMEGYTATGTNFTAEEVQKMTGDTYKVVDGKLYEKDDVETVDGKEQPKTGKSAVTSAAVPVDKVGLKAPENTPTRTFKGWKAGTTSASYEKGATPVSPDKNIAFTSTDGKTFKFGTVYAVTEKATTDKDINENLKNLDKAKKDADTAKDNNDKLQKLDEKYGANIKGDDDFNGSNKQTGENAKIKVNPIRKIKSGDTMDDYFTHAANVAGAPSAWTDDGTNTWVYEAAIPAGLKVSDGHTVRLEFDLELGDKADLSKFTWKVYHIEGWCKATKVKNVEIVGNKLYAWVDSCSPFVVTRGDVNGASAGTKDASNPSTGDFSAVPVALLAAAALGATGFVAYKKRKAE